MSIILSMTICSYATLIANSSAICRINDNKHKKHTFLLGQLQCNNNQLYEPWGYPEAEEMDKTILPQSLSRLECNKYEIFFYSIQTHRSKKVLSNILEGNSQSKQWPYHFPLLKKTSRRSYSKQSHLPRKSTGIISKFELILYKS